MYVVGGMGAGVNNPSCISATHVFESAMYVSKVHSGLLGPSSSSWAVYLQCMCIFAILLHLYCLHPLGDGIGCWGDWVADCQLLTCVVRTVSEFLCEKRVMLYMLS